MEKRYYFITYNGYHKREGHRNLVRHRVIDTSPMDFILMINNICDTFYTDFIIVNSLEITKSDYLKHRHNFK